MNLKKPKSINTNTERVEIEKIGQVQLVFFECIIEKLMSMKCETKKEDC
jgi:hypothetical protein